MKKSVGLKRVGIIVALLALAGAAVASTARINAANNPEPEKSCGTCPGH